MKNLLPCLLLFVIPMLSGCWDQLEIEQRSFIIGIGIDTIGTEELEPSQIMEPGLTQPRPHQIRVAMEIPKLQALGGAGGGGTGGGEGGASAQERASQILVTTGVNLTKTVKELRLRTNRQTFLGHLRLILVSEEFAREEGLHRIMDFFFREPEIHREVAFFITKGKAEDVLRISPPDDNFASVYVENLVNMEGLSSRFFFISIGDLSTELYEDGNALIGRISAEKTESVSGGSAVIKDWRFAGFMGEIETLGARFLLNRVNRENIAVEGRKGGWHGARILNTKRIITPIWDGENLTLEYRFNTEGDIREAPGIYAILDSDQRVGKVSRRYVIISNQGGYG